MSPRRSAPAGSGGRIAVTVLLVVLVALGLFLLVRARPDPGALDPRSEGSDGARALVLLLEQYGATVEVVRSVPADVDTRVLVLEDSLDDAQRGALLDWIDAGGIAVVADPASSLHGAPGLDRGSVRVTAEAPVVGPIDSATSQSNVLNGSCTIAALEHLRGVFVRDGLLFPTGDSEPHCFGGGAGEDGAAEDGRSHAFVIRRDIGDGIVLGLGDNRLLTNALIRFADNSGLAVALLAPEPGGRVSIVLGNTAARSPEDLASGDDSLGDLVRPGVWMGLAQLAIAFVVLALARGVRPGRPVDEPLPSPLEGSESVRARGTTMRRARHSARAGWLLRSELHRDLCDRYRISRASSARDVDAVAAERDGTAPGAVAALLASETPDPASLLELSNRIGRLRARWAHELPPLAAASVGARTATAAQFMDRTPGEDR